MTDPSEKNLNEMARLQELLDHHNLWQLESRITEVLEQLGLDADMELASPKQFLRTGRRTNNYPSGLIFLHEPYPARGCNVVW
jgi:ATPase subunit of ABC transporter with duplicated ATPase domains